jgi:hypothetical protein
LQPRSGQRLQRITDMKNGQRVNFPNDGFTLVELILALFFFAIVTGACGDAATEIIVYSLDTVNQRITREPWTCSGSPISAGVQSFLGAAAGETKTARVVNADAGVAIPLFRYFNSTGTDITGSLPGAINQIRRIEITLVVDSENVDPSLAGSQRRRMIYSTSVVPRNHAFLF